MFIHKHFQPNHYIADRTGIYRLKGHPNFPQPLKIKYIQSQLMHETIVKFILFSLLPGHKLLIMSLALLSIFKFNQQTFRKYMLKGHFD